MADNTTLNPGTGGDTYSSDDIGGVKTQRIKVQLGDDGISDGDVSDLNPLPVKLQTVQGTDLAAGSGVAANALRVELPVDGQGTVSAKTSPVLNSPGSSVAVPNTDTSTPIVAANPTRKSCLLHNEGADEVRIGVGEAADATKIRMLPGGYLAFDGVGAIAGFVAVGASGPVTVSFTDESY